MIGTNRPMTRCICLMGDIGVSVYCDIYNLRASVCREFEASWNNGLKNERCDKARMAWGLAPLEPDRFDDRGKPDKAA